MHLKTAVPFLVACLGVASFTAMDAVMKSLSLAIGVYNAMLWRMLAGALIGGSLFVLTRTRWPARAALRLHVLRGAISSVMATTFFWGIVRVPLAEGVAITFIAPLIALYLAAALLGETIGRAAILASVLGLAGVVTIAAGALSFQPTDEAIEGIAALLVSAVLYAWNLVLQRRQAQIARPFEIAFFQNLVVLVVLSVFAPFLAVVPAVVHLPQVLGAAIFALIAVLLMSWAYARAEAQVLVTVEYTAFIWAALLGWWFFAEKLSGTALAGTVLIVAGCIIANFRRRAPAAEHVEASAV